MATGRRYPFQYTPSSQEAPNLHLFSWRKCIAEFEELRRIVDRDPPSYDGRAFAQQAALVLILAGTALTQLEGQNDAFYPRRKNDLDHVAQPRVIANVTPESALDHFLRAYDDLRHFGPPRYADAQAIGNRLLDDDATTLVIGLLRAAQSRWLERAPADPSYPADDVTNQVFAFGDEQGSISPGGDGE